MKMNPLLMTDGYKTSHIRQYPPNTELVYSNYTCRDLKYMPDQCKDIVVFGIQYMIDYIHELFEENFFMKDKDRVCYNAKVILSNYLGTDFDVTHFRDLHGLGYLPIEIKALEEGSIIKKGIPLFTIKNTLPQFFWVTNFLETLMSSLIWKPVHSASMAYGYKKILTKYAQETGMPPMFVLFQGHDFSFRGMQSPESAISSGMGFLTCFQGTDTIPALEAMEHYYGTSDAGYSVPATEHSVMSSHGKDNERETIEYLLDQYPTGILSIVSDTWDLWNLITVHLVNLKERIMARDGKVVIRPDSGNPVDIICGQPKEEWTRSIKDIPKQKGVVELLWDIFGGTVNEQGYKVLDSHIGCIYGDSITPERAVEIAERLKAKGFANQVVFGVGSYSMGYATRDQQGGAVKSTCVQINGKLMEIFKDPITDDGTKKSAKGLLRVDKVGNKFILKDQCTWEEEAGGELRSVYKNGYFYNRVNLKTIRDNIDNSLSS